MYLPRSNASRVSNRVWMGPWRRRVRRVPSSQHGCAVPEAAVGGTRAWTALGHREVPKCRTYLTSYRWRCRKRSSEHAIDVRHLRKGHNYALLSNPGTHHNPLSALIALEAWSM